MTETCDWDDLVQRDNLHYKKFSDVPFTGKTTGKIQGTFRDGKKDGPWVGYHENGQLMSKGTWKDGKREGPWVIYKKDGTADEKDTGTYKDGKKDGPPEKPSPSKTEKQKKLEAKSDSLKESKVINPEKDLPSKTEEQIRLKTIKELHSMQRYTYVKPRPYNNDSKLQINHRVNMGFFNSVKICFVKYLNFSDRASRPEYWFFVLFCFLASFIIGFSETSIQVYMGVPFYDVSRTVHTLCGLAIIIPSISVGVRRLHDTNKSGWWILLSLTIIGVIPLIYWYCKKGDEGKNRFGPNIDM